MANTEPDCKKKDAVTRKDALAAMKQISREVAEAWASPKTALEILIEQRR